MLTVQFIEVHYFTAISKIFSPNKDKAVNNLTHQENERKLICTGERLHNIPNFAVVILQQFALQYVRLK